MNTVSVDRPLPLRARLAVAAGIFSLVAGAVLLGGWAAWMRGTGRVVYVPTPTIIELRCPGCGEMVREEGP